MAEYICIVVRCYDNAVEYYAIPWGRLDNARRYRLKSSGNNNTLHWDLKCQTPLENAIFKSCGNFNIFIVFVISY